LWEKAGLFTTEARSTEKRDLNARTFIHEWTRSSRMQSEVAYQILSYMPSIHVHSCRFVDNRILSALRASVVNSHPTVPTGSANRFDPMFLDDAQKPKRRPAGFRLPRSQSDTRFSTHSCIAQTPAAKTCSRSRNARICDGLISSTTSRHASSNSRIVTC